MGLCGGIVTAYNPASRALPERENRAAQGRLRGRLLEAGASLEDALAIPGEPGAEAWREPGFLVRHLARKELVAIAGEFGQNAVVWIPPGGAPELVCTRDGFAGRRPGETISGTDTDDARS